MLNDKRLFDSTRIRFADGAGITLNHVANAVQNKANELGIPIAYYKDRVKFGGRFGGSIDDCLVFHHPDHKNDYFNYVVRVTSQGGYGFLAIEKTGVSKMGHKMAMSDKETRKEATRGESMAYKIAFNTTAKISSIGANRNVFDRECDWYNMVEDTFKAVTM